MKQGKACELLAKHLLQAGLDRLILDAAMLYALPPHDHAARKAPAPILLPHDREMAALIGCDEEDANREPLHCGQECARRYGALVLVKGPQSHIVAPDGKAWKYQGGGPGLGISGSGDALAGIVGGLLARGAEPLTALLWGVWLHGEAGAVLAKKVGPVGFLAREISAEVPALLAKAQPSFK
jgi:NAD(P)H-hydrate repair Nnr-like enzyme with NAD(P)H-hydrate dehydratase domain